MNKRLLSSITEDYAAFFLISQGYEILGNNFSSASGEIDLIACQNSRDLSFTEVKGRQLGSFVLARETMTKNKIEKIEETALVYLNNREVNWQIDFLAITYDMNLKVVEIDFFENIAGL